MPGHEKITLAVEDRVKYNSTLLKFKNNSALLKFNRTLPWCKV
jgi:hypothetical protein